MISDEDLPAGYHRAAQQWLEPPEDREEERDNSDLLYERARDEELEKNAPPHWTDEDPEDLADFGSGEEFDIIDEPEGGN
jgi:hypothetical protein